MKKVIANILYYIGKFIVILFIVFVCVLLFFGFLEMGNGNVFLGALKFVGALVVVALITSLAAFLVNWVQKTRAGT